MGRHHLFSWLGQEKYHEHHRHKFSWTGYFCLGQEKCHESSSSHLDQAFTPASWTELSFIHSLLNFLSRAQVKNQPARKNIKMVYTMACCSTKLLVSNVEYGIVDDGFWFGWYHEWNVGITLSIECSTLVAFVSDFASSW